MNKVVVVCNKEHEKGYEDYAGVCLLCEVEYHKNRAARWRAEAYKLVGHEIEVPDPYERGFIDGMEEQMKRSVDRAVNAMVAEKQEPVAWLCEPDENGLYGLPLTEGTCKKCFPVYTHPKPLVGLTPEEVSAIWQSMGTWSSTNIQAVYNAIWRAIKEKNNG